MNQVSIGWYTRDGDLEFFTKVSKELQVSETQVENHYICHTRKEQKTLQSQFNVQATVLGDYIEDFHDNENIDVDQELKELENNYHFMPLRKLAWADMYELNRSDQEIASDIIAHFKFFEKFCSERHIKVIVSEGPGILAASVLWTVCKRNNILFIEYTPIGLPGRKNFRTSWEDGIFNLEDHLLNVQIDKSSDLFTKSKTYLKSMQTTYTPPPYVGIDLNTGRKIKTGESYWKFPKKKLRLKTITESYSRALKRRRDNNYYLSNKNVLLPYAKWALTAVRQKLLSNSRLFSSASILNGKKYFFFPLHVLHEWCDYPWMGPAYNKIDEVIGMISDSLPLGFNVVVKEHPALFPEKPIPFYRKIKQIRNVILLGPAEDTHEIVLNSAGVITLGGTSGWEAFLIGKPVFLLADSWYRSFLGIKRIHTVFDLVSALQNYQDIELPSMKEKLRIIYTLYEISFPAKHYPITEINSNWNISQCASALSELIFQEFGYE